MIHCETSRFGHMTDLIPRPPLVPLKARPCPRCGEHLMHQTGLWFGRRTICVRCLIIRAAIATIVGAAASVITLLLTLARPAPVPQAAPISNVQPPSAQPRAATSTAKAAIPPNVPQSHMMQPNNSKFVSKQARMEQSGLQPPQSFRQPARQLSQIRNMTPPESQPPEALETTDARSPDPSPIGVTVDPVAGGQPSQLESKVPVYKEQTTVTAASVTRPSQPLNELALPQVPTSFKSYMSGRCVVFEIIVSAAGTVRVTTISSEGIDSYFVDAAVRDVSRPWRPALTDSGEPTSDSHVVRYCWP